MSENLYCNDNILAKRTKKKIQILRSTLLFDDVINSKLNVSIIFRNIAPSTNLFFVENSTISNSEFLSRANATTGKPQFPWDSVVEATNYCLRHT